MRTTAFLALDLQIGIVTLPLAPYTGAEVVSKCAHIAQASRAAAGAVFLVRVSFTADGRDRLAPSVDAPLRRGLSSLPGN